MPCDSLLKPCTLKIGYRTLTWQWFQAMKHEIDWNSSIEALPKGVAGDFPFSEQSSIVRFGNHLPIGFPMVFFNSPGSGWPSGGSLHALGIGRGLGSKPRRPGQDVAWKANLAGDLIEKKVVSGRINPLLMRQDQDHQLLGCFKCPTVAPRFWNSWKIPFISLSYSHFFVIYN
jgi:hypothetical protein